MEYLEKEINIQDEKYSKLKEKFKSGMKEMKGVCNSYEKLISLLKYHK